MDADLSQEIQRFEEKFAENPDSLVFARLADLYRKAGEPERALGVLDDGLDRHPDYLSAHIVRARALRDLGREPEAERVFERVLRMDSQNLVALRSLGELALERDDREEARRRFESLLELDPRNQEVRERLEAMTGGGPVPGPGEGPTGAGGGEPPEPGDEGGEDSSGRPATGARGEPEPGPGTESGAVFDLGDPDRASADEPSSAAEDGEAPAEDHEPAEERPPAAEDAPVAADDEPAVAGDDAPAPEGPMERAEDEPRPAEPGAARPDPDDEPPGPAAGDDDVLPTSREEAEFLGLEEPDGGSEPAEEEGLPAEEGLRERIEELSVEEGGAAARGGEDDDQDLLTETLASLYETQGFYEEAVEMYEELLRQRPGDEGLRQRLEDARTALEGTDASDGPAATPGETPELPAEDDAPTEPSHAAGGEPSTASPPEPGAGGRAGASVRDHLRALLRGEAEADTGRRPPGSGA